MRVNLYMSVAIAILSCSVQAAPQIIIFNADVFTADPERPRAHALAVDAGRISAVGSDAQVLKTAAPQTRLIDAGGRLVTPGLIEAHVHLASALPQFAVPSAPLRMPGMPFPGPSAEQALGAVEAAAPVATGWITAFISQSVARDQRNWRDALDAVAPDKPVMLRAFWGHTTILNSAALKQLGIAEDAQDPIGGWWGRDPTGRLNGRAYESAEWLGWDRIAPPDPKRLAVIFQEAARRYAAWGVTSIHLMNNARSLETTLDTLARLEHRQKWTVYSWAGSPARIADAWAVMDAAPKKLPERVRIDGPKWILDGTPIEQNALQRQPYPGRPDWHGRSNLSDEQLGEVLRTATKRPEQLILHVVGDAETARLFDAMEAIAAPEVWKPKRVRVEHGDGIRAATLPQAVRLGVVVTQNPTHFLVASPAGTPARPVEEMSKVRSLLAAGVPLALGSDAGGAEANPFLNIMLASTYASAPTEALSREQALTAYTTGAAYAERQEGSKGRIRVGMAADLAILSQNVLLVPLDALPATTSLLTLVDGQIILEDEVLTRPEK